MPLLGKTAAGKVHRVIGMIDRGEIESARAELVRLSGFQEPAADAGFSVHHPHALDGVMQRAGFTPNGPSLALDVRLEPPARPAEAFERDAELVMPLPRPASRVVNPAACRAYKRVVGRCETKGPDCWGPLDYSHILAKSQGGDDIPETNGLVQCRVHHDLWEASRLGWWRAVSDRLCRPARAKVLRWYPGLPYGDDRHPAERKGSA